jgi:hypothetical protein
MLSIFSHICWKFVLLPLKSVSSIAHLLIEVFFCLFFWVLYIFWVVRWIASKIFSHSVGCWLSVLLYRSFLILPHLSICVLIFQAIGFLFQKSLPISVSWSFSCVYYFQSFMSFFFFWQSWGLKSGLCTSILWATPSALCTLVILEVGSCFFAQAGLTWDPPILCSPN